MEESGNEGMRSLWIIMGREQGGSYERNWECYMKESLYVTGKGLGRNL